MAEKLIKYYDFVKKAKGLSGAMKLAAMTKLPSTKAAFEPDNLENINKFKKAVEEITGEKAPNF